MIFDWLEYLKFAEATLAKTSEFENSEAVYRSVTSRAYYAVYCLTRNTIKQKDRQEFFGSAHQQLQDYLIAHTHNVRSRLGRRLRALHQLHVLLHLWLHGGQKRCDRNCFITLTHGWDPRQ